MVKNATTGQKRERINMFFCKSKNNRIIKIFKLLLVALSFYCLAGCHHDKDGSHLQLNQDVRMAPGKYIMDEPEILTSYFEMLCDDYGAEVAVHINDFDDSLEIWHAVRCLDEYSAGKRAYYPVDEVRDALGHMAFELGYRYSHIFYEGTNYAEIFFFRFLEQAVRLSPKLDFVTDFHSADGSAGILNYHEWSPSPLYSFLIYPTEKGFRVQMVGEEGDTKIEKLFLLTDKTGREYYLCSNNGNNNLPYDSFAFLFRQYLFLRENGTVRQVAAVKGEEFLVDDKFDGTVVFNPRLLRWDCCKRSGDTYHRVEGTPSLLLQLDGEKSKFVVERR